MPEAVPPQPDLGDPLNERGVLQARPAPRRPTARPAGAAAPRRTRPPSVAASCATRRSMPGARRRAVRISWMRGREHLAGTRGDGAAGQLLEEQGDAGSALDDLAALRRIELAVGQRGDQPGRLLLLQRFQLDVDDPRGPRRRRRGTRLVIRIMVPGMRWVARSPSRSTVVGSAQWRSSAHDQGRRRWPPCGPAR